MNNAISVEQALAGNHQAFNSLIKDCYADIYGMILSWVKNPEDAKDLTQDVFISAYLDLPSLKDHRRFHCWLRQIARHKCQNWRRKQTDFIPLHDDLISKEPLSDELLIMRETLAKVMEAIDSLPESEKVLLKEHYFDDVSYDELKARHGVSTGSLATQLFRARQKIKDRLEKTLSVFVAFFHDHAENILTGGTEIVKANVKIKLIASGTLLLLVLGGTGILINQYYIQNESKQGISQTSLESNLKLSGKLTSSNESSSIKKAIESTKKEIAHEKIQAGESKAEISAMNEAKSNESVKNAKFSKLFGKTIDNENLTQEMKQKADIYAELSSILPEYMQLESLLIDMSSKGEINDEASRRFGELDDRIFEMFKSILHPPAIMVDEYGNKLRGIQNTNPALEQIGEYMGKELPFDGNSDYFAAKDYQGGTGGW